MSTFSPNDKVICMTPPRLPHNNNRDYYGYDFSFPNGFIEEGEIYCVESVRIGSDGTSHLTLVGKPALHHHRETGWSSQYFRKVAPRKRNFTAQSKQHLLGRPVSTLVHRI